MQLNWEKGFYIPWGEWRKRGMEGRGKAEDPKEFRTSWHSLHSTLLLFGIVILDTLLLWEGLLVVLKILCDVKVGHCLFYCGAWLLGLVHVLFGNTQLTSAIRARHAPPCRLLNGGSWTGTKCYFLFSCGGRVVKGLTGSRRGGGPAGSISQGSLLFSGIHLDIKSKGWFNLLNACFFKMFSFWSRCTPGNPFC